MTRDAVVGVFVYGTLKRGECREGCWPLAPQSVAPAWTRGALYSRRDYPALRDGDDRVVGELWRFAVESFTTVLAVLDEIEQTNQPGLPDLYHRVLLPVWTFNGRKRENAMAYHYATDPCEDGFVRIEPDASDWVAWHSSARR